MLLFFFTKRLSCPHGLSLSRSFSVSLKALLTLHFPCFTQNWFPADGLAALASMGPRSFPVHPSALSLADRGSNPPTALSLPTVKNYFKIITGFWFKQVVNENHFKHAFHL